jgi:hypothetical protein
MHLGGGRVKTKVPVSYRTAFVLILVFVSLIITVHTPRVVANEKDLFPLLIDGKTTREEIKQNCPYIEDLTITSLSQGRIVFYSVDFDQNKGRFICPPGTESQLVLVFDEKDILKRHSILKR